MYSKTYSLYKQARNSAWQILIDNNIVKFPYDIIEIIQQNNIYTIELDKIKNNENLKTITEAAAITHNGKQYIIYNPNANPKRLYFSLAHEFGHIILEHEKRNPNEYKEHAANIFARCLIMPAIVCQEEQLTTPEQISDFFGVSLQAATIRANRVNLLKERNAWLTSPLEQKYLLLYKSNKNK